MTRSAHCNSHYAFFSTTNYTNFSNRVFNLMYPGTWASRPRCREAYNTDVDVVLFLSRVFLSPGKRGK